jgi:hypothetical protein
VLGGQGLQEGLVVLGLPGTAGRLGCHRVRSSRIDVSVAMSILVRWAFRERSGGQPG